MQKAILIGAGPGIEKFGQLKTIAKSKFDGYLFIVDVMLRRCLDAGITPDKFPKFYVVSVEYGTYIRNFYTRDLTYELTKKHAPKITALLFVEETDFTAILRQLKFNVVVLPENKYSRTFANVGITGWWLAHTMFECNDICLIGLNMSWDDEYIKQFPDYFKGLFFKEGFNPELNCTYWLDPLYEYFRETFIEWLEKYPDVKTTNATGEGSLHCKFIKQGDLKNWLREKN